VEVTGPTSAVPEPRTPSFLGLGLAALIAFDAVSKLRARLTGNRNPSVLL
jgi:hypothetical protein